MGQPATDWEPISRDPNFVPKHAILFWKDDRGDEHFSQLYAPSPEALSWDAVPEGVNVAMGSRFGCFLYLKVEETGRKPTRIFGSRAYHRPEGMRVKITFTSTSFDGVEFSDTATGWVVDRSEKN